MIDRAIGAIPVDIGADLLHGLYVVVFPVPQIEPGFVFGRCRVGRSLGTLRSTTEEQVLSIFGEAERSPVADYEAGLESRRSAGHKFGSRRTLAVPQVEFEF